MKKATREETLSSISASYERISNIIVETPLIESKWLSEETGCNIYLKMESEQVTGSLKLRGAANKIKVLEEKWNHVDESTQSITNGNHDQPLNPTGLKGILSISNGNQVVTKNGINKTLVAASSGNHGLACALVASKLGINMRIYSYLQMSKTKEKMLSLYKNTELLKYGKTFCAADAYGRSEAKKHCLPFISAYNDIDIINGQATIGIELLKQKKDLDAVFITVGGGGVISGIATYLKLMKPNIRIIACQPAVDCCMYESIKAGHIVQDNVFTKTISDGSSGRVEPSTITFDIIRKYVDDWVLVEERDIEQAIFDMLVNHNKIIEGASGCVIAGVRKVKEKLKGLNIALVICGSNLGMKHLSNIVAKYS